MGGSKTQTQQVQQQQQNSNTTNTYGYVPGAQSTDIDAVRNFEFESDPAIPYNFARARRAISGVYGSPMGAYTTDALRQATLANQYEDLAQEEAQATRESNNSLQGMRYGQRLDTANLTQPRFVQTGGTTNASGTSTGSGTSTQSQSPLNSIIQGGSAVGSALLM